jgi:hypothetical protein
LHPKDAGSCTADQDTCDVMNGKRTTEPYGGRLLSGKGCRAWGSVYVVTNRRGFISDREWSFNDRELRGSQAATSVRRSMAETTILCGSRKRNSLRFKQLFLPRSLGPWCSVVLTETRPCPS